MPPEKEINTLSVVVLWHAIYEILTTPALICMPPEKEINTLSVVVLWHAIFITYLYQKFDILRNMLILHQHSTLYPCRTYVWIACHSVIHTICQNLWSCKTCSHLLKANETGRVCCLIFDSGHFTLPQYSLENELPPIYSKYRFLINDTQDITASTTHFTGLPLRSHLVWFDRSGCTVDETLNLWVFYVDRWCSGTICISMHKLHLLLLHGHLHFLPHPLCWTAYQLFHCAGVRKQLRLPSWTLAILKFWTFVIRTCFTNNALLNISIFHYLFQYIYLIYETNTYLHMKGVFSEPNKHVV